MPNIQHKDIADAQLHEPKGVAGANAGDIYVADGAGSGTWATAEALGSGAAMAGGQIVADGSGGLDFIRYAGWGQWQDTDVTVGAPSQTLSPAVRTQWTNDGGALTTTKSPSDLTVPLWNTSTNLHQPIAENDIYHVRVNFFAENYAGAAPYIELELDIGGGVGTIFTDSRALRKGGSPQALSFSFPVFAGSTYLANGGKVYLTYQGTGTCAIYKSSILIVRESKNYV